MTTETDRELLELAAKAEGLELDWDVPPKSPPWVMTGEGEDRGPAYQWNPLTDDGDALRLATDLGLCVRRGFDFDMPSPGNVVIAMFGMKAKATESLDGVDKCAATRRAIVRAAAAIGKAMP